jgi:hypothetical protein
LAVQGYITIRFAKHVNALLGAEDQDSA